MKAADTLERYGLSAFGADIDSEKANAGLIAWAQAHPRGLDFATGHLGFKLESLLQKAGAIDDGRSTGFRLDEDEAAILDILLAAGCAFAVRRDDMAIRKA